MSVNIMDLVKGAVSDQVMGQIGGLLGTDAKKTPSLFETAAGSILGGMMKKASTPQGAQDIFGAVQKQDSGILDKLGDLLGGGDSTDQFEKQGSGILDMVLGGSQQSSGMIGMVAKALGLDKGIVGKLLMMAAPIIMGVIGKHIKNAALDAVGLGKLLGDQKSHLAGFMPSSLTGDLGLGNLVGKAGDIAGSATDAVGNIAGAGGKLAGNAAGAATSAASNAGGGLLKFLIPLGLLAVLGMYFGPGLWEKMQVAKAATGARKGEVNAAPVAGAGTRVGDVDFTALPELAAIGESGKKLGAGLNDITIGLRGVKDKESAKACAETVTAFNSQFDSLGLDKLEGEAKEATSTVASIFIEAARSQMGYTPRGGVLAIIKPSMDELLKKLSKYGSSSEPAGPGLGR